MSTKKEPKVEDFTHYRAYCNDEQKFVGPLRNTWKEAENDAIAHANQTGDSAEPVGIQ